MQFIKEDERLAIAEKRPVLVEALGFTRGYATSARDLALIVAGVGALVLAANIRVPMWPVPVTMQTLAVLMIGAGYGLRLGLVTVLAYLALGAAGVAVFAGESAGLAYMAGPTGGYLVGFVVAAGLMAALARRGWDRTVLRMGAAMILGNAAIYACGLAWMSALFAADKGMGWVLQYGMVNFLPGDALKIALAAMLMPLLWRAVKR
ncbi:biotin transporter BioY [Aquicoccus porphyridii]|uniref:Biotin transporter n=1 Tax=Aquicoccus porphyridii TaxID=1852029 RepID=A0A5A9ZUQ3_9RHOB|nr:biotin transporter BioY [Aquicoccus porphyridii]KAA0920656.1 biotin transporter BioY [Aquicoccus porphyridii]RAI56790.1 biotin transporter BioY [Rhodobacteraceae bacterium AsT-22]